MKIKKLLSIIFVLMLMFAFCVAFTACDDEETHVHTFSDSLTNDTHITGILLLVNIPKR